jgi:4-aminobutyrate aminotransferase-like enzyme
MQGIEFVHDRQSKRHNPALRDRIVRNCVFKQRLWILGAGRSSIRLLPALITTEEQGMEAVDRFVVAVREETGTLATEQAVAAATP